MSDNANVVCLSKSLGGLNALAFIVVGMIQGIRAAQVSILCTYKSHLQKYGLKSHPFEDLNRYICGLIRKGTSLCVCAGETTNCVGQMCL